MIKGQLVNLLKLALHKRARTTELKGAFSKADIKLIQVLHEEGFIAGWHTRGLQGPQGDPLQPSAITVHFHPHDRRAFTNIYSLSKPGRKYHVSYKDLLNMRINSGFNTMHVVSTNEFGICSHKTALGAGIGGEVLCKVE
eukprot:Colp12_sorted_trinity150504_noHs@14749